MIQNPNTSGSFWWSRSTSMQASELTVQKPSPSPSSQTRVLRRLSPRSVPPTGRTRARSTKGWSRGSTGVLSNPLPVQRRPSK